MKESGDVSKSQSYGAMKKGKCVICGDDVSKLSWKKQEQHGIDCQNYIENERMQTRL